MIRNCFLLPNLFFELFPALILRIVVFFSDTPAHSELVIVYGYRNSLGYKIAIRGNFSLLVVFSSKIICLI
jgi:hypothetical protein